MDPQIDQQIDPKINPEFLQILNQNIIKPVSGIVSGTNASSATFYGRFFEADRSWVVISITESHRVAGSDAGAVTVSVEKCGVGVAPGSGVDLLASALSLKATADTDQYGTLTNTKADLILKKGDRLILKDTGVLTAVEDVCVTVLLRSQ